MIALGTIYLLSQPAHAQTYSIIHSFVENENVGGNPTAGVTIDADGNLYGTASGVYAGGAGGVGGVFKMSQKNAYWIFIPLYDFPDSEYGPAYPSGGVVRDTSGVLYGTAEGGANQEGTVFKLQPPPTIPTSVISPWIETIVYNFIHNGIDGVGPYGGMTFDQAGSLYGTTMAGGTYYDGTVFKLTPSRDGGWTESVIYSFNAEDGSNPLSVLVFDKAGNLYGTTVLGGRYNCGTVFELTPSGPRWSETVLYNFAGDGDGCRPWAGVILDEAGNLYGATVMTDAEPPGNGGTVFELSSSDGSWNYRLLHTFTGGRSSQCSGGWGTGPSSSLTMDSSGALYGTTQGNGAYGEGNVFKLAPANGGWLYTSLYDFGSFFDDGLNPCGGVTFDASGNLYGTTFTGGYYPVDRSAGTVWEIAP